MREGTFICAALACALTVPATAAASGLAPHEPTLAMHLYGDVNLGGSFDEDQPPVFSLGMLDVFAQSTLSPRISALAELMAGTHDGAPLVRLPRLFAEFQLAPAVALRVGQFHAPLGYYTTSTPTGGALFRLATERPRLLSMDPGEQMIPNRMLGLRAFGAIAPGSALEVRWDAAIGENATRPPVTAQLMKALAARIALRPGGALDGLEVGGSVALDQVEVVPGEAAEQMWERAVVGYAAWHRYPVEAVGEVHWLVHSEKLAGGASYPLLGGFAQLGWSIGAVTPYVRYQTFERDREDPIYEASDQPRGIHEGAVGIRYSPHPQVVIKAQGSYDVSTTSHHVATQIAFGF